MGKSKGTSFLNDYSLLYGFLKENTYTETMQALRLQEVVTTVQTYFDRQFSGRTFWCKAEVLQAKQHKTRVYLDLVEYDATGAILAKMRAIIRERELIHVYMRAHGLEHIEELCGQVLLCEATCAFHAQWGVSLHITSLSHEFARGQLHQQQERIREALREQGLYATNKQQEFAIFPARLAVISSKNSEGLHDFVSIVEQSGWAIEIDLFPAAIHGEMAKKEVSEQLAKIYAQQEEYTAVVITRGGGGGEGLARQNDQTIAEMIGKLSLPVILATGHTTDTSLLDELVWHAAKTPSDAAHMIVENYETLFSSLEKLEQDIEQQVQYILSFYQANIEHWYSQIDLNVSFLYGCLSERVEHRWQMIDMLHPSHQLQRGYALLRDIDGKLLDKDSIDLLAPDDILVVETSQKRITTKVQSVSE